MPVFFFHHHAPQMTMWDDIGCSFETLELAYLDAYRGMIDIGAELLKRQEDPYGHRIEIADGDGRALMELSFSEVFHRRRRPRLTPTQLKIFEELKRARRIRAELDTVCASARGSVAEAHEMLRRVRTPR